MSALNVAKTVGSAALEAAKEMGPDVMKATKEYIAKSGSRLSAEKMASGSIGEQTVVMRGAINAGVPLSRIMGEFRVLTAAEQARFAGVMRALAERQASANDSAKTAALSSGDPSLDNALTDARIINLHRITGWTSDQMGQVMDALATLKHSDLERYQRDERIRGNRPV